MFQMEEQVPREGEGIMANIREGFSFCSALVRTQHSRIPSVFLALLQLKHNKTNYY